MRVDREQTVKITIHLTEEEAKWLAAVMQNPVDSSAFSENVTDTNMRTTFYEYLKGVLL